MSTPLISLRDLTIAFRGQPHPAVRRLNLDIFPGERLAIVGESGSGKSLTAMSILSLIDQATISGQIRYQGNNLLAEPDARLQQIRGRDIAMIFQEPMTALNPLHTIGDQVAEPLRQHVGLGRQAALAQAVELLARTGLTDPARQARRYPHQLSGGQRQRAMIAMALACRPKLLIADEPTTALDASIRARIIELLLTLQQEFGMAVLIITHDLNTVRRFAERVAVMRKGEVVEVAACETLFERPAHPYTRHLLDSQPRSTAPQADPDAPVVLESRQLSVRYSQPRPGLSGLFRRDHFFAVADASFTLRRGETLGIVGESGSGKSTLAQAVLGLIPTHEGVVSFPSANPRSARSFRRDVQVVFQDPFGSLSPRRTIRQLMAEGLDLHYPQLTPEARHLRLLSALRDVSLPESTLYRYPHEFSGGQRQRIAIARALCLRPKVLVLDEPTSALDVSIQKQVLELLLALQAKYQLSYLLISHDLAVVRALSHRICVMRAGRIIEQASTDALLATPAHPYTRALIQASL